MGMEYDGIDGDPTPASLEIRLFGAPEIVRDGRPLNELKSAKARALLFYLALTGRAHTRPALANLLWGDMPDTTARSNLRRAIHHLRQVLDPYLIVEREVVALAEHAGLWVDAVEFEALLRKNRGTGADEPLQQAVDLYRGDLLEGFYVRQAADFERWWLAEQGRLRDMMLGALTTLAAQQADQGNFDEAISLTRRLLELEPWREGAHRRLMRWLALAGQRSAALAAYEICRKALEEELGVEPDEETAALHEKIRQGELKRTPPVPPIRPVVPGAGPPDWLGPATGDIDARDQPTVGRERELARLEGFLERALVGDGHAAFVSGEAGWGKTHLVAEFSRRAQERHPALIVASGVCTTFTETGDPYLPFREILRSLSADVEQGWASGRLTQQHARRLWDFFPQVVETLVMEGPQLIDTFVPGEALLGRAAGHGALDADLIRRLEDVIARGRMSRGDAGVDQERIFEQVVGVLRALAAHRPLLLILDDLHWADSSSLSLLFHLGHHLGGSRILVLSTYRPEDVSLGRGGQRHPLAEILAEFKRLFGDVWVPLGQEPREARAFIDALLDVEPNRLGGEFRSRLAQNTRGHPLFAVEMLHDLQDRQCIYREEGSGWVESPTITWDTLPRRVEGVIERRVDRLKPALRAALAAASVEGEEFTAEVVAQLRRVDAADMVELLSSDLARKHQLVQASGTRRLGTRRVSRYRFSHNLFQKYLYNTLDPVERAYRHEAVGRALERVYRGHTEEIAVHLATHFQEAGRLSKAVEYLHQAGDAAARVYANTEAIALFGQAIELAHGLDIDEEELIHLYTHLGRALELDSQFDRVVSTYEAMEQLARRRGFRHMELAALMARATIQSVPTAVHDAEQARILGQRALRLAAELGDRAAEARILWSLSLANYFLNHLDDAIECGERSLAIARELGLVEQTAQTLNDLGGFIYLYSGRIEQAREALAEASELWRSLGNTPMLVDSLGGSCIAHVFAGEYDRAIALSDVALRLSQEIENRWSQSYSLWTIGDAYRARGEYSRAIEASEECIRLGEQAGFLAAQTYTRLKLAMSYADLGAFEHAMQLTRTALDVAEGQGLRAHLTLALSVLARLQVLMGDLAQAEATIDGGKTPAEDESWAALNLAAVAADTELALRRQDYARAAEAGEDLVSRLRAYGMRSGLPEALYLRGKALLGLGEEGAARACFVDARAEAEGMGDRQLLWRILSALAELEDEPAAAAALREQARDVVQYIADHVDQPALRARFLGLPAVERVVQAAGVE